MNNKGFTLVELLAVISIIAILSIIAVPNVVSVIDNNKKDQMLSDAKKLISQAKYQVTMDKTIRQSGNYKFTFTTLNKTGDIGLDPDGGNYLALHFLSWRLNCPYAHSLQWNPITLFFSRVIMRYALHSSQVSRFEEAHL